MTRYQDWKRNAQELIAALPEQGATIVVCTNEWGRHLKRGVAELRGDRLARACRFVSAYRHCDCPKLEKLRGTVVIDSSVTMAAKPDVAQRIVASVAGSGAEASG